VAFVGFCIGSGWVTAALAVAGDRIAAAALIDGCELGDRLGAEPRFIEPIPTKVYLAFPSAMSQSFSDALTRLVVSGRIEPLAEVVPDTRHGFCFRDWPGGAYDDDVRGSVFGRATRLFTEAFETNASR
jgi:dienelactone hydrolase